MVRYLGLRLGYYYLRGAAHKLAALAMVEGRLLSLPAVRIHSAGVAIPERRLPNLPLVVKLRAANYPLSICKLLV